jgi:hypothetical protein
MKFKVGDAVRVKPKEWFDNLNKSASGVIYGPEGSINVFTSDMLAYAGMVLHIGHINKQNQTYGVKEHGWYWEDWMFEDKPVGCIEMRFHVGDAVRVKSKEWFGSQEKDITGSVRPPTGFYQSFTKPMYTVAGSVVHIRSFDRDCCRYRIEECGYVWEDWMFDSRYEEENNSCADASEASAEEGAPGSGGGLSSAKCRLLTVVEAVVAMFHEGKTLYDSEGYTCRWDGFKAAFTRRKPGGEVSVLQSFMDLYDKPPSAKRPMTRFEILGWANSEASRGWVVRYGGDDSICGWNVPQLQYADNLSLYRRARLLPDGSGVDECTIQRFEVDA